MPWSPCNRQLLIQVWKNQIFPVRVAALSLARAGLLDSHRGSKGGYRLARPAAQISVVQMISALEGPVAMTECVNHPGSCSQEDSCGLQGPWQRINGAVQDALEKITLADLAAPGESGAALGPEFVPLVGLDGPSAHTPAAEARRDAAKPGSR